MHLQRLAYSIDEIHCIDEFHAIHKIHSIHQIRCIARVHWKRRYWVWYNSINC